VLTALAFPLSPSAAKPRIWITAPSSGTALSGVVTFAVAARSAGKAEFPSRSATSASDVSVRTKDTLSIDQAGVQPQHHEPEVALPIVGRERELDHVADHRLCLLGCLLDGHRLVVSPAARGQERGEGASEKSSARRAQALGSAWTHSLPASFRCVAESQVTESARR
jgi:hypothetical protein